MDMGDGYGRWIWMGVMGDGYGQSYGMIDRGDAAVMG